MIAVIFEVMPDKGKKEDYLNMAKALRTELDTVAGFISIERFQSLVNPDKILSLSFWESEESVSKWRNNTKHRNAQMAGRNWVFKDYRLRVGAIVRDYGMCERKQAPIDHIFNMDI